MHLPGLTGVAFKNRTTDVSQASDTRYRLIWHERTQRNLGMSWLRAQIYELFSGIGSADE
jgi:hypothetical protein